MGRLASLNRLPWALLLGLALVVSLPAPLLAANGTPINVVLGYLNGVSTWGPTNASGVAEIVTRDGEVRMSATGLPRLSGEEYVLWIVDSGQSVRQPLGAFNASESGVARLDEVLEQSIPERNWDLLLVSVEPEGSRPATPSSRHSIAGRFPAPTGSQGQPAELPRTGGSGQPGGTSNLTTGVVSGVLFLILGAALGFGLSRLTNRRKAR